MDGPLVSLVFIDSSSCSLAVLYCSEAEVCRVWMVVVKAFSNVCCCAKMAISVGSIGVVVDDGIGVDDGTGGKDVVWVGCDVTGGEKG